MLIAPVRPHTAQPDTARLHRRKLVMGACALLLMTPVLAACSDEEPSQPEIPFSAVTSLTLIRSGGDQVVRAQVKNPLDEVASFTVRVSLASPEGTKVGEATVKVSTVDPGSKKSGNSTPLDPKVPARTTLILTGVERATP